MENQVLENFFVESALMQPIQFFNHVHYCTLVHYCTNVQCHHFDYSEHLYSVIILILVNICTGGHLSIGYEVYTRVYHGIPLLSSYIFVI